VSEPPPYNRRVPYATQEDELTHRETRPWRYAVGMFGTSIPISMFLAYMAFFYIDGRGLDARVYAAVMVGYAVLDAIDNPVYGYLSDRTRTRYGRRRPWLVIGAPLLALSLVAFFSPPESATGWALVAWFAGFAVLTETLDSLVNANYGALLPELFPQQDRRATANGLRQGCQLVALIISIALTPMVASWIGYQATAAIYGALATAVILYMATGAHEDPRARLTREPHIIESVRAIFGTGTFWRIAVANGAYAGTMAVVLAATPFFVKYTLELPNSSATYLLATVILISIGTLVLWIRAVHRFGPLRVWRLALVILAASLVPMYFASSLPSAMVAGAFVGLGYSGVIATVDLVIARLIDVDAARTGLRREAMFISAFGFFNRLGGVLKSLAFLSVVALFGFVSGDEPGERPDEAARFLMTVFPLGLVLVAAVTARFVRVPEDGPHGVPPVPADTRDLP
jgi:GPH family glycoside/pentoside/hexuronide:cation symporter